MDIQTEVQKIHHQYGVSEKANYEIQKLFDKAIKEAVTEAKSTQELLALKFDKAIKEAVTEALTPNVTLLATFDKAIKEAVTEALRIHDVVGRSEQFKCGKCSSNWGELRATCFNCGHESEDLST